MLALYHDKKYCATKYLMVKYKYIKCKILKRNDNCECMARYVA